MPKEKKHQPKNPRINIRFLRSLEEEDRMHDDHGAVIIGRRDQKPIIPEEKKITEK